MDKIRDYLRISEAAEYLGVSPGTLRNWEQQGKIRAHRVPQNGYRLFRLPDLKAVLREVGRSPLKRERTKLAGRNQRRA
ncbi:MAG: helix-turn-helix domain-containing protein [Planctomycetes bacterium]|nr:helix-turn-helix domain-containing protein [Planctomycetota bacterium]